MPRWYTCGERGRKHGKQMRIVVYVRKRIVTGTFKKGVGNE